MGPSDFPEIDGFIDSHRESLAEYKAATGDLQAFVKTGISPPVMISLLWRVKAKSVDIDRPLTTTAAPSNGNIGLRSSTRHVIGSSDVVEFHECKCFLYSRFGPTATGVRRRRIRGVRNSFCS